LTCAYNPNFARSGRSFFGDKKVIRSWIHTSRTFSGLPAGVSARPGASMNAIVCSQLECLNYQPKQNGLDRFEQIDI
jgi:hypothetical protein